MSQELTIEEERAIFYGALTGYGAAETYSTKPQLSWAQNSKGPEVKELQELLLAKGYSLGIWGADSLFEGATETAVKQFQANVGLPVTGVANTATWQVLLGQTATKGEKTLSVLEDILQGFGKGAETFAPLFTPRGGVLPAAQTQTQQSSAPPAPGTPWGTIALVGGGIVVLGLLIWGGSKLVGGGE